MQESSDSAFRDDIDDADFDIVRMHLDVKLHPMIALVMLMMIV